MKKTSRRTQLLHAAVPALWCPADWCAGASFKWVWLYYLHFSFEQVPRILFCVLKCEFLGVIYSSEMQHSETRMPLSFNCLFKWTNELCDSEQCFHVAFKTFPLFEGCFSPDCSVKNCVHYLKFLAVHWHLT